MNKLGTIGAGILVGVFALSPCEKTEKPLEIANKPPATEKINNIQQETKSKIEQYLVIPGECPPKTMTCGNSCPPICESDSQDKQLTCNSPEGSVNGEINFKQLAEIEQIKQNILEWRAGLR